MENPDLVLRLPVAFCEALECDAVLESKLPKFCIYSLIGTTWICDGDTLQDPSLGRRIMTASLSDRSRVGADHCDVGMVMASRTG